MAAWLALAAPTHAQPPQPTLDDWLPQLQKGRWVDVEGPWVDGVLQAEEIKVVNGELDQVEVGSIVASVDSTARRFRTELGVEIVTTQRTEFQAAGVPTALEALRPGVWVETDGQLQRDGTVLADEVEIKQRRQGKHSTAKLVYHELTGRIDSVDPASRSLTVLGVTVRCDERTRNKTRFLQ